MTAKRGNGKAGFRIKNIKTYRVEQLKEFLRQAVLSQGSGADFNQTTENRINMIKGQLIKLGEEVKF